MSLAEPRPLSAVPAPDTRPVYEIERLSKTYARNNLTALADVNLTLRKGEFVSVIGSSGCGKSTLLKIMAGLLPPTTGRVVLEGRPVTGPRSDIGMMFQQATLLPWKTTIENIVLPVGIREGRGAARAARERARDLLSLVGLGEFGNVYPGELSGGMAQRAAICRMLISDPAVLLLDEPFSALDELTRDFMNMELQRICLEREATAFLVTHSLAEAVILSDRILVMKSRPGRIVEDVEIDLPRPRTLAMINTSRFGEIVAHIRDLLGREAFPVTDKPDTVWVEREALIDRIPRWLAMTLLLVAVVAVWDFATRMGAVSPIILPTPAETLADLVFVGRNLLAGDYMLEALWTTTRTVAYGFLIATGIGFSLGVLVGETKFGERAVMPYLVAIDTMPKVAFAPLFIAWLGFDIASKVALAAFIATFPIVVSTAAGLGAATENERMLFRAMGASRLQTLLRLKLPTGLPYIFTGLKIAAVGVMAGAITGEFLGGGRGFGALIRQSASQMDTPRVFALILYLSLLGLLLYFVVVWAQRRFVFWNRSGRPGAVG